MNSTPLTFFLLLLLHLHLSSSQTLINSTCKSAARSSPNVNYTFCRTSLQAAPASECASLRGLGMISIRLIRYNVTDTRCHIKQLLKSAAIRDPYVRQCLSDCFDLYSDAIPSTKDAMKSYNSQRFDDANVRISSVMEASTTCEQGFKERRGVVSPLSKRNADLFQLGALSLSVMRAVQDTLFL